MNQLERHAETLADLREIDHHFGSDRLLARVTDNKRVLLGDPMGI